MVADHIVAVVPLDPIELVRGGSVAVPELEPLLEGDDARTGISKIHLALESVERLHLLDRIALYRGSERLADGAQEVDQDATSQEPVDLVLAGPVPAHQP